MTQLAHWARCYVVGTCSSRNESLVRSCGADEIIDYTQTSISEWATEHDKVDVVFDTVGGKSLQDAWHAVREGGKIITIVPPADMVWKWILDAPEGVSDTIEGKFFVMEPDVAQLRTITELIEAGVARPVVDSVYNLDEYQAAFDRVDSKRAVGKVVLKIAE
jgi:NADPH:quinone reductase-like Zn-dependent oxidoreductase